MRILEAKGDKAEVGNICGVLLSKNLYP